MISQPISIGRGRSMSELAAQELEKTQPRGLADAFDLQSDFMRMLDMNEHRGRAGKTLACESGCRQTEMQDMPAPAAKFPDQEGPTGLQSVSLSALNENQMQDELEVLVGVVGGAGSKDCLNELLIVCSGLSDHLGGSSWWCRSISDLSF